MKNQLFLFALLITVFACKQEKEMVLEKEAIMESAKAKVVTPAYPENLTKVFKKAAQEDSIIFIDEFDSLGKIRDYNQDHGEMKRVVNTILQLFDYLPQSSIVTAATNQENMIDEALLRRFDVNLKFPLPNKFQIEELIQLTLNKGNFTVPSKTALNKIIKQCESLSYYSIQKTLINAIKRTLFKQIDNQKLTPKIDVLLWAELIDLEKKALKK